MGFFSWYSTLEDEDIVPINVDEYLRREVIDVKPLITYNVFVAGFAPQSVKADSRKSAGKKVRDSLGKNAKILGIRAV